MVDNSQFTVTFTAKDGGLRAQLDQVGTTAERTGKRIERSFGRASKATAGLNRSVTFLAAKLAPLTAAFSAAFAAREAFRGANEFSRAIAEVGTIAGVTSDELNDLRDASLNIATGLGLNEVDAAQGLYQTLSAGITDAGDALLVLNQAAELAVAGVSSTSASVDLLTSVINAYGFDAADAQDISDKLFQTVRLGKTTIDELSSSIGQAAPQAAQLGVSFEELLSAAATLTLNGLSTSEAFTQINAAQTALLKRSDDIREVFEAAGDSVGAFDLRGRGLVPVLEDLRTAVGGSEEELVKLLGRAEAARAVFGLTGEGAETFADTLTQVEDAAGSTSDALGVQFENATVRLEASFNAIRQGLVELADVFITALVGDGASSAEEFQDSLVNLRESVASARPFFEALGATVRLVFNGIQISVRTALLAFTLLPAAVSDITTSLLELANRGFVPLRTVVTQFARDAVDDFAAIVDAAATFAGFFNDGAESVGRGVAAVIRAGGSTIRDGLGAELEATLREAEDKVKESGVRLGNIQRDLIQSLTGATIEGEGPLNPAELLFGDLDVSAVLEDGDVQQFTKAIADLWEISVREGTKLGAEEGAEDAASAARALLERLSGGQDGEESRATAALERARQGLEDTGDEAEESERKVEGFWGGFGAGAITGIETIEEIGANFGFTLSSAFDQLSAGLARGEDAWDRFKDTALSAIAQIASQLLTSGILQAFGFSAAGTSTAPTTTTTSATTTLPGSFALGGTLGKGGKPINFGAFPMGGVVRDPTLALFGDQSDSFKGEAFVPIPGDAQGIPVDFRGNAPMSDGGMSVTIVNEFKVDASDAASFNNRLAQGETRELIENIFVEAIQGRNPGVRSEVRAVANSA